MRPRSEYTREQGSPAPASFPSKDQCPRFCQGAVLVAVIDTRAQNRRCRCCLAGVQLPAGMHSADNPRAGALPRAVRGSLELLASSKAQPSSNAPYISNVRSMPSCWEKSASVGGAIPYILMKIYSFIEFVEVIKKDGVEADCP